MAATRRIREITTLITYLPWAQTKGVFTWRLGTPGRWSNPPVIWPCLHDRWSDPPHVATSISWGPPPPPLLCKEALRYRISILQLYSLAVAGPNGVELFQVKAGDPLSVVCMKYFYFSIVYPFLHFSFAELRLAFISRKSLRRCILIWPLDWCSFPLMNSTWRWYVGFILHRTPTPLTLLQEPKRAQVKAQ